MRKTTIKGRLMTYNIGVLLFFVALTAIVFNVSIRLYIEKDTSRQMIRIAERAEMTAIKKGPDFFAKPGTPLRSESLENSNMNTALRNGVRPPEPPPELRVFRDPLNLKEGNRTQNELFRFYFMLDRSLREPLSMLSADYVLLDGNSQKVQAPESDYFKVAPEVLKAITDEIAKNPNSQTDLELRAHLSSGDYLAVIRPVSEKNSFGLSWIVVYSSLEKINQLQLAINGILLVILAVAGMLSALFSSYAARKIAEPFSALNGHLNHIASRNFGATLDLNVDDELKDFVSNINRMSLALAEYDKAQKTFLQNASHEFRTPLMSIQGHAEGILYEVMEARSASAVIVEESRRMTRLVEDLLYLSRLEAIEESYHFHEFDSAGFLKSLKERMGVIADRYSVTLEVAAEQGAAVTLCGDEEKLIRAISNLISNGCRHASSKVRVEARYMAPSRVCFVVQDDGDGFDEKEMPHLFERFYKGSQGDFGLGLAIAKAVVERHGGVIYAENTNKGARVTVELPVTPEFNTDFT